MSRPNTVCSPPWPPGPCQQQPLRCTRPRRSPAVSCSHSTRSLITPSALFCRRHRKQAPRRSEGGARCVPSVAQRRQGPPASPLSAWAANEAPAWQLPPSIGSPAQHAGGSSTRAHAALPSAHFAASAAVCLARALPGPGRRPAPSLVDRFDFGASQENCPLPPRRARPGPLELRFSPPNAVASGGVSHLSDLLTRSGSHSSTFGHTASAQSPTHRARFLRHLPLCFFRHSIAALGPSLTAPACLREDGGRLLHTVGYHSSSWVNAKYTVNPSSLAGPERRRSITT